MRRFIGHLLVSWLDEIASARRPGYMRDPAYAVFIACLGLLVIAAVIAIAIAAAWGLATMVVTGHIVELAALGVGVAVLIGVGVVISWATDPTRSHDDDRARGGF